MSTFVLMELCKQSGVKNVIYQLLAPSITLNLDEVEENRSYAGKSPLARMAVPI